MAQALARRPRLWHALHLPAVSPAPAFAIRFGTATALAIWIGHLPGLVENHSSWILITVLMVLQPEAGGSLKKGILRALGTLAAAFAAIGLAFFAQDPPLLFAGLLLSQAICAYGFAGPRNQYAWFVTGFTAAVILLDVVSGSIAVETAAFQRVGMVGIGLVIAFAVDALLWPTRAERSLRQGLVARLRSHATSLREAIAAPLRGGEAASGAGGGPPELAGLLGLADAARSEVGVTRARADALAHLAVLIEGLAAVERILGRPVERAGSSLPASFESALADLGRAVEDALAEAARAIEEDRAPKGFAQELERELLRLENELSRSSVCSSSWAQGWVGDLRRLVTLLCNIEGVLASPPAPASLNARGAPTLHIRWPKPDALRVKISIRTSIAVGAGVLAMMALGWDLNVVVPPVVFMLAATPTRGGVSRSVVGLGVAVAAGWVAADAALVFLYPNAASRMPGALAYPFLVSAAFAYVSVLRPQLATLRTIGSLVALLPVFGGTGAPTDVSGSYDTVCYMGLAIVVAIAAGRMFFPATAARLFRQRAAAQLELCLRALSPAEPGPDERTQQAIAFTAQRAQLGQLATAADAELSSESLDASRRVELVALIQDLFDAAMRTEPSLAAEDVPVGAPEALGAALQRLHRALVASIEATAEALRASGSRPTAALREASSAVASELGEPGRSDRDPERTAALLAYLDAERFLVSRQLEIEAWLGRLDEATA